MSRADEQAMANLHGLLAKALAQKIEDGTATAADLSVAAKFLKDNGIDCVGSQNANVTSLAESMDFPVDVADILEFKR